MSFKITNLVLEVILFLARSSRQRSLPPTVPFPQYTEVYDESVSSYYFQQIHTSHTRSRSLHKNTTVTLQKIIIQLKKQNACGPHDINKLVLVLFLLSLFVSLQINLVFNQFKKFLPLPTDVLFYYFVLCVLLQFLVIFNINTRNIGYVKYRGTYTSLV